MVTFLTCTSGWKVYHSKSSSHPCGRYGHSTITFKDKLILHAGFNGQTRLNDTYQCDLIDPQKRHWALIETRGEKPSPRDCHSAILYGNKMIIFGGGDGLSWLNDTFEYNVDSLEWKEIETRTTTKEGKPSKRAGHSAVQYKNSMIIFGGWNGKNTLNDCYEFNFVTNEWKELWSFGDIPQPRDSHSAVIYSNKMIIAGGGDGSKRLNDVYEFNLDLQCWKVLNCLGDVNCLRAGHKAVVYDSKMVIFGGGDGNKWHDDLYELDLNGYRWSKIIAKGNRAPGSYGVSASLYKNQMVLFGGGDGERWYDSIYEYKISDESKIRNMKSKMLQNEKFVDVIFNISN